MSSSKREGQTADSPRENDSRLGGIVRAQSETLGVLLIVGVVLVLAAAMAIFVVSDFGTEEPPELTSLDIEVSEDTITVSHQGGDTLDPEELEVIVISNDSRSEVPLNEVDYEQPDEPDRFVSGERFVMADGPYTNDVTVLVVHKPTETILADQEFNVNPDLIVTIDNITAASAGSTGLSSSDSDLFVGDGVNVTFTLANQGSAYNLDVTTALDGETVSDDDISLAEGENWTKTVSVASSNVSLDDGLEVEVDADQSIAFESLDAPFLAVDFSYTLDSSQATVDYSVENTGDIGDEQTLELVSESPSGGPPDSRTETVNVSGGESLSGTFDNVDVVAGGTLNFSSDDESITKSLGDGDFAVSDFAIDFDAPDNGSEAWVGHNITVDYQIQNNAGLADTKDIEVLLDNSLATEENVTLGAGETYNGTYEYTVVNDDAPDITAEVSTEDDSEAESVPIYVPEDPNFQVDIDIPDPANYDTFYLGEGDSLDVTATVNNTGEESDTQTITLDAGALGTDSTTVTLDGGVGTGEETTVTLSVPTSSGDAGEYSLSVSSNNATDSADAEILTELPDLLASLGPVEGSVGDTVEVGLDVVTLGGTSGDNLESYQFVLSYDDSVVNITGVQGAEWSSPFSFNVNDAGDGASVADFSLGEQTPSDPGLTLEVEIVGQGSSAIEFDDTVAGIPGSNYIDDGDSGNPYDVLYENATVETDASTFGANTLGSDASGPVTASTAASDADGSAVSSQDDLVVSTENVT